MALESLGDLILQVGADLSPLEDTLQSVPSVAQQAGAAIDSALTGALDSATTSLTNLANVTGVGGQNMALLDDSAMAAAAGFTLFAQSAEEVAAAVDAIPKQQDLFDVNSIEATDTAFGSLDQTLAKVADSSEKVAESEQHVSEASHEVESAVGAMGERMLALAEAFVIFEGLKEIATDAIHAAGGIEQFTVAMTALSGSSAKAEEALAGIEKIAATQPFALPDLAQAAQKMTAMGLSAETTQKMLQAAADAAAATGNSFSAVAGAMERVALSGTVSARQLVQLGLSWDQLAASMGVSVAEAQSLMKKGGQSAIDDLEQLITAAEGRFAGMGEKMGQTMEGQFQVLENQMHAVFVELGTALAPALQQIVNVLRDDLIPAIKTVVEMFSSLPAPVRDVGIASGALAVGLGLAEASVKALNLSFETLKVTMNSIPYLALIAAGYDLVTSMNEWLKAEDNADKSEAQRIAGLEKATATLKAHGVVIDVERQSLDVWARAVQHGFEQLGTLTTATNDHTTSAQKNLAALQGQKDAQEAAAAAAKHAADVQKALQQQLDDWAQSVHEATDKADKLAESITAMAEKDKWAADQLTGDAAGWVESMGKRAAAVEDLDKKTERAFKDMLQSFHDLGDSLRESQEILSTLDQDLATLGDTFTVTMKDGAQSTAKVVEITKTLAQQLGATTQAYLQMAGQMHQSGLLLQQDYDAQIARLKSTLALMQQFHEPMEQQLTVQQQILTLEVQRAAATGTNIEAAKGYAAELETIREHHEKINAAINSQADLQRAVYESLKPITDQTLILTDAWKGMTSAFSEAFHTMSTGIAQSIVEGKSFSEVWHGIITKLAEDIITVLIETALKELALSLITNTNFITNMGSAFTSMLNAFKGVQTAAQTTSNTVNAASTGAMQNISNVGSNALGIINTISGVVSAVFGALSFFTERHMAADLQKIEKSTRYTEIYTGEQSDSILNTTHLMLEQLKLIDADIKATTTAVGSIKGGGSGTGSVTGTVGTVPSGDIVSPDDPLFAATTVIKNALGGDAASLTDLTAILKDISGSTMNLPDAIARLESSGLTFEQASQTLRDAGVTFLDTSTTVINQLSSGINTTIGTVSGVAQAALNTITSTQTAVAAATVGVMAAVMTIVPAAAIVAAPRMSVGSLNQYGINTGLPTGAAGPYVGNGPSGLTLNFNGPVVGGAAGMRELGNTLTDQMRRAGMKF